MNGEDRRKIDREYLAPIRGLIVALALTIPFWIMLGVVIGMLVCGCSVAP